MNQATLWYAKDPITHLLPALRLRLPLEKIYEQKIQSLAEEIQIDEYALCDYITQEDKLTTVYKYFGKRSLLISFTAFYDYHARKESNKLFDSSPKNVVGYPGVRINISPFRDINTDTDDFCGETLLQTLKESAVYSLTIQLKSPLWKMYLMKTELKYAASESLVSPVHTLLLESFMKQVAASCDLDKLLEQQKDALVGLEEKYGKLQK